MHELPKAFTQDAGIFVEKDDVHKPWAVRPAAFGCLGVASERLVAKAESGRRRSD